MGVFFCLGSAIGWHPLKFLLHTFDHSQVKAVANVSKSGLPLGAHLEMMMGMSHEPLLTGGLCHGGPSHGLLMARSGHRKSNLGVHMMIVSHHHPGKVPLIPGGTHAGDATESRG